MSFFELAAKFGGLSTQESDDHEGYTGPRDYGYTQTTAYESGYDGAPPTGYPSGPQRGQAEYKRSHEGYSTSDPARAYSDFGGRDCRPGSPALPDGWIKRFDERHGRWYYVDETTGTSQWEPPKTAVDDGEYGGSQHASKDQVYDAHSGAGEAAGYYAGHHYGQNAALYGQAPVQDYRFGQHGGASYAEGHDYGAPVAYEDDRDFAPYEEQKPSPVSDSEESREDTESSESESGDDEVEAEEEFEKQSSHESSGSESGDDNGSGHEDEDQEYPSGDDDEWSGEE
ncbi:Superoxide dismutase [Verticillium dahliae VDG1]|nr:Superoxide dismutase [Verticillium dahliae VDG1]